MTDATFHGPVSGAAWAPVGRLAVYANMSRSWLQEKSHKTHLLLLRASRYGQPYNRRS